MTHRTSLILVALAAAPLLAGCTKKESVDSQDVTTHGMSLEMEVVNDGTKTKVTAGLHVGSYQSSVWARLSTGDQLILVDSKGESRALSVINSSGKTEYGTELAPMDGEFKLDFVRAKGASALGNKVTVPASFTVAVPASHSRATPLTFTWGASTNGAMAYSLSGSCISSHISKSIIGDPGTFTINAGEIKAFSGKEMESCQLTLKVTRTVSTQACCSPEFGHPSRTGGVQERTVTFTSTP